VHALAAAKPHLQADHDVVVRIRPFLLNPDQPAAPLDRAAALARKFPDPDQRAAMADALQGAAAEIGLDFDPATPAILPASLPAHRFIAFAHGSGRQEAVTAAILDAYWRRGEDISAPDRLADLARRARMPEADIDRVLAAPDGPVAREAAAFAAGGVTGAPTFIINEKTGFAGTPPRLAEAILTAAAD